MQQMKDAYFWEDTKNRKSYSRREEIEFRNTAIVIKIRATQKSSKNVFRIPIFSYLIRNLEQFMQ